MEGVDEVEGVLGVKVATLHHANGMELMIAFQGPDSWNDWNQIVVGYTHESWVVLLDEMG